MYKTLKRNWDKAKFILLSGFVVIFLLLLTVVYKSDEEITKISENNKNSYDVSDLKTFKQFILDQIKSPFINIDYKIYYPINFPNSNCPSSIFLISPSSTPSSSIQSLIGKCIPNMFCTLSINSCPFHS